MKDVIKVLRIADVQNEEGWIRLSVSNAIKDDARVWIFLHSPPPPRLKFFPNRGGGAEQCCKEDAGRMKELDRMQNSQEAEDRETAKEMTGKGHLYSWELLT